MGQFAAVVSVHIGWGTAALLALVGFIAGGVNAVAGGGSLLSFPALLAVGYPAVQANVTNTVALVPGYLGGSLAYREELKPQRRRLIILGSVSFIGGLAGAILLVTSPGSVFRAIVPWLILFSCGLLGVQPLVTKWVQEKTQGGDAPLPVQVVAQIACAVYGGYFGAGLGVMMLAFLGLFLDDSLQKLNALKGLLSLIINLVAAVFFVIFGPVAWLPVLIMAGASLLGGNLGVFVARRLSPVVLRSVVVCVGVAVAVKLLI
jgi:uncharacterized membrane protein YfcA